jgi:transposase
MRALELKRQGWKQRDIASALDVSKGAVSQWLAAARRGGPEALYAPPPPGRTPKLSSAQLRWVPEFLGHGAEAYGFRGAVWTCSRVARVIEEEYGVSSSHSQVSRWLRALNWSPQVPMTRALQRDEVAIERWRVEGWPALRRRAKRKRQVIVFVDEAGFYLLPGMVKTYGPPGQTPLLSEWQTRDHLSVMGGVTPQGKLYVLVRRQSLNGLHPVEFLKHLLRYLGPRLLVIWDGSPIHRRYRSQCLLEQPRRSGHRGRTLAWIHPRPPLDAGVWQHLKHVEMRNLACLDLEELHLEFHLAIGRLRQKPRLIQSFFRAAGLA